MTYTEGVQLWRDNIYIASDRMDVWPKEKRFAAEGNVRSKMEALDGVSRRFDYDDVRQTVRYEGGVRLRKADMTMEGDAVTALIKEGRIAGAEALGAVTVIQGVRRGTGDRAVFDAASDRVTLTGKPARIEDPEHGKSEGLTAVMDLAAKNASISGAAEGSPPGRVSSQTKVKR
jgi:lipopolysaccharide export system protein LptA